MSPKQLRWLHLVTIRCIYKCVVCVCVYVCMCVCVCVCMCMCACVLCLAKKMSASFTRVVTRTPPHDLCMMALELLCTLLVHVAKGMGVTASAMVAMTAGTIMHTASKGRLGDWIGERDEYQDKGLKR